MIKVGIVGGTGYTGVELLRLLAQHPQAEMFDVPRGNLDGIGDVEGDVFDVHGGNFRGCNQLLWW